MKNCTVFLPAAVKYDSSVSDVMKYEPQSVQVGRQKRVDLEGIGGKMAGGKVGKAVMHLLKLTICSTLSLSESKAMTSAWERALGTDIDECGGNLSDLMGQEIPPRPKASNCKCASLCVPASRHT